ncbi:MAG: signal peptidase I [SAR202 cluster bacterium]|jgi:signal peptidase I|nr:signal peptidase I [SAR202 cluster bacterium]MDP6513486.1 signal peptidase I [SAR202 cluster bacterium]MDP6715877.1 signal peptidase I [SAR202 cluster bacterium]
MKSILKGILEILVVGLVVFLTLTYGVQNIRVSGSSMEPTLHDGEFMLANKLVYLRFNPDNLRKWLPFISVEGDEPVFAFHPPSQGDVVVFSRESSATGYYVKRVVGVAGDTVEIRRGQVFINGTAQLEPHITSASRDSFGPLMVPPHSYFVLGDNRNSSTDSRKWGPIPEESIVGRAWVSFWPFDQFRLLTALSD